MNYQLLAEEIRQHVITFFKEKDDTFFPYHNLYHTLEVVKAAAQIANHYQLNDRDFFITSAAAWFHDNGYFIDPKNHEEKGAELAETFLQEKQVDTDTTQAVKQCIMATRMPQKPEGLLQQIVCDADLFHVGLNDFTERSKLMRKEVESTKQTSISKHEWRQNTIRFLQEHQFQTQYCRLLLGAEKQKNLDILLKKEKEWLDENTPAIAAQDPLVNTDDGNEKLHEKNTKGSKNGKSGISLTTTDSSKKTGKHKDDERPARGIETMFRVTSSNHQRLSDMADNKAHIMITVNSIILSAIISLLLRRLEDNPYLTIPTFIILAVSLIAMVFAILSTRPTIPNGTFTTEEVANKTVNLLFFGNFYRMGLPEYDAGMKEVMNDSDFLYGSLIKDVYSQGVVLGRKYRLLRISYNVFMFGLIISVAAFIIASALVNKR